MCVALATHAHETGIISAPRPSRLAAALSEEADAIEDMYEPYLIQIGFLERTPRGRVATARAYEYFGRTMPGRGLF